MAHFMAANRKTLRGLASVALMVWSLGAWAQDALEGPKTYYTIESDRATIGYIEVTGPVPGDLDGRPVLRSADKARVEAKALGQELTIRADSTLVVDAETLEVLSYDWSFERGELKRRLECRNVDGVLTVRGWQGDEETDPITAEWGDEVAIRADLDVSTLALLARRFPLEPGETRDIRVLVPESDGEMTLSGLEPTTVEVLGETREGRRLGLDESVVLVVDPETSQVLAVYQRNGQRVMSLTDESVIEAAAASSDIDLLESHFARVPEPIPDFASVTRLVADVEITVPIIGDEGAVVVESPMQAFDGAVEESVVRGTLTIESRAYDGTGAAAFPLTLEVPEDAAPATKPSLYIESDDADIAALARELTEGAATAWEATTRVAEWVHANIGGVAVADSPSAKLALETRRGDCGPHATLTCALLRAVGIPAKLVGGLTYAPQFGGSFGQHAWVEAWVGEPGWISFDSTTGEIDSLSAVHVKLFEGMGGVLPRKFEIGERIGGGDSSEGELRTIELPYDLDTEYVWRYVVEGDEVGAETITFSRGEAGAGYKAVAVARFGEGDEAAAFTRTVTLDETLTPLTWETRVEAGGEDTTTTLLPRPAGQELAEGVWLLENNTMLPMALILPRMVLEEGRTATYQFYSVGAGMQIALPFELGEEKATFTLGGETLDCTVIELPMAQAEFLLDERGRLLAEHAPGATIELR